MNRIFNQLLNVKDTVVETARIADSPQRPTPVLEIRVRPRNGHAPMLEVRQTSSWLRPGRWCASLAAPGLRLPAGGAGRCDAARGLPGMRGRGRPSAVGRARQPVHQGFRDGMRVADDRRRPEDCQRVPARRVGGAGDIAHRVAERLRAGMPSPFDGLTAIGVDGTSCRKGRTYLTVVVDHERHRVIRAHDGYGKDVFGLFFKALTPRQRASIRVITGDGARWIDSCVAEHCPNAQRVLDGFHIVSWMTGALDKVGKRLWNQAGREHDEETTRRMRGVKYAVLKNPDPLTDKRNEAFDALRNTDPKGQLYPAPGGSRNSSGPCSDTPSTGHAAN